MYASASFICDIALAYAAHGVFFPNFNTMHSSLNIFAYNNIYLFLCKKQNKPMYTMCTYSEIFTLMFICYHLVLPASIH